jgi:hypothetical protein
MVATILCWLGIIGIACFLGGELMTLNTSKNIKPTLAAAPFLVLLGAAVAKYIGM